MWASLFAKRPQVIKPGLSRVKAALAYLPELTTAVPGVTVGGTNGKGTTSGFLTQMLAAAGVKAGLYTSPHLQDFRERFWFDGNMLSDADIAAELEAFKSKVPADVYDALSFFEVATLLAWQAFNARGSELNVMEVGLGGRFDATNAGEPVATIITSIGLDHCEYLGNDVASIAMEKAGIMRGGRPVFWGQRADGDVATTVIRDRARDLQAPVWSLGEHFKVGNDHVVLSLPELPSFEAPLPDAAKCWPPYLRENFAKAAACFYWLLHQPFAAPWLARAGKTPGALMRHVAAQYASLARPPSMIARFDLRQLPGVGPVLFDVCHNPQGAGALAAGLGRHYPGRHLPGLVSILGDKDHDAILDILRTHLDPIVLFPATSERALKREALGDRHQDIAWAGDLPAAWELAARSLARHGGPLVACGSVHAVGEVLAFLEGRRPDS